MNSEYINTTKDKNSLFLNSYIEGSFWIAAVLVTI